MRSGVYNRKTNETEIKTTVNLDIQEACKINTGIGFFDHMLELFAFRAGIFVEIEAKGDLHIDNHHTVEDVGICLGKAVSEALGDRIGIARYGSTWIPMDEALVHVVLDISGRGQLVYNAALPSHAINNFETELVEEFFRAFAHNAGITLHVNMTYGRNTHHIIEAMFKALGGVLAQAITISSFSVASTKGVL